MPDLLKIFTDLSERGLGVFAWVGLGMILLALLYWKFWRIWGQVRWGLDQIRAILVLRRLVRNQKRKIENLEQDLTTTKQELQKVEMSRAELWLKYDVQKNTVVKLFGHQKTIKATLSLAGRVWSKPLGENAPAFLPLQDRETPIISVVNLKGGVGKSTISGNLGATCSQSGRVLLIDLDYQSSLSLLSIIPDRNLLDLLQMRKQTIHDFFAEGEHSPESLFQRKTAIRDKIPGDIVITNDALADIEMDLMLRSLLDPDYKKMSGCCATGTPLTVASKELQVRHLGLSAETDDRHINARLQRFHLDPRCSRLHVPAPSDPTPRFASCHEQYVFQHFTSRSGSKPEFRMEQVHSATRSRLAKIQGVCNDVAKRGHIDLSFFETTIKDDSKFAKAAADSLPCCG